MDEWKLKKIPRGKRKLEKSRNAKTERGQERKKRKKKIIRKKKTRNE